MPADSNAYPGGLPVLHHAHYLATIPADRKNCEG